MKNFNQDYIDMIYELKENIYSKKLNISKVSKKNNFSPFTIYRYFSFKASMPLDIYLKLKNTVESEE